MLLCDINVLIYAFRHDVAHHEAYRTWLHRLLDGDENFGVSDLVLSGFLRIVTQSKLFNPTTPANVALAFVRQIRAHPHCVVVRPGSRHWEIFVSLYSRCDIKGTLVTDTYLAALAIEHGCEWITTDRDFARFPGLRWRHPLH